ncbi:helix-turn-helix transcriptional regulator [Pacificimonas sp. WHA3]|uniref:Helix-turn-helix transcriptional regulator n=1 Tax=Pacificimonas pallii TaxID=2827236 RepID=A0ABS6SEW2_9SPHN|nr:helix-turn-helix transcriptional regulator [Pacificimonas pallii]MBV7256947.1 helix-turn-helix transcriptional regulator [Pacificimonas pallii]
MMAAVMPISSAQPGDETPPGAAGVTFEQIIEAAPALMSADRAAALDTLTKTEKAVLRVLGEGLADKQIADRLFISDRTLETHLRNLRGKLGLAHRSQMIAMAGVLSIVRW